VLMLETDILLLDEPTNHLDLQATEWLQRYLNNYTGAVVIISHDRYLLDRIATKIVEVDRRNTIVWKGNYTNYIKSKDIALLQQEREHEHRVEMVERTREFIAKNKDQEGMRGTARGRKTRLDKMLKENPDFLEGPNSQKAINFKFAQSDRKSHLIFSCEKLSKSFDDLVLFDSLTFDILTGERIGITGPNGTGKSTLIKMLMGELKPSSGTIRRGEKLGVGYLDQHGDTLNPEHTVLDAAREANPALSPEQIRNRLGAFLFSGDDVFKNVQGLSGGQRNRLMLCRLVLKGPDILIMDEPTNHLDIASREMLEQALDHYNGTIIVVSHDRYFLDKTADKLFIVGSDELGQHCLGKTEFVTGKPTYSYYAGLIQERREQQSQEEAPAKKAKKKKQQDNKARQTTPEELKRFNRLTVDEIEEKIMIHEDEITHLKERFGDEVVYKNPHLLKTLHQEYDAKTEELELLYRAYERRG
jgi:ATP-binding cassette, subfamily F, member 3